MSSPAINTHGLEVTFGKHRGELWTRVPVSYLRWIVNTFTQDREARDIAQAELDRRGTVVPDIEISGHAIDTASLRVRKIWHENRGQDEGLHAWLCRMAMEAYEQGERLPSGKIKHAGIKWVFEEGNYYPTLKTVMRAGKKRKE